MVENSVLEGGADANNSSGSYRQKQFFKYWNFEWTLPQTPFLHI